MADAGMRSIAGWTHKLSTTTTAATTATTAMICTAISTTVSTISTTVAVPASAARSNGRLHRFTAFQDDERGIRIVLCGRNVTNLTPITLVQAKA